MTRITWAILLALATTSCGDPTTPLANFPPVDPGTGAICSPRTPTGLCPAGRICRQGACIIDLDPGEPIDTQEALSRLEAIWSFYNQSYGAFPAKTVDWPAVRTAYHTRIEDATSAFEASWLLSLMVDQLHDGHSYAMDRQRCDLTGQLGQGYSNVGACVTEIQGGTLHVYRLGPFNPAGFELGDELLSIDGRDVDALLGDLEQQPRCVLQASTPAMSRGQLVDGLLLRAPGQRRVELRRDGRVVTLMVTVEPSQTDLLRCDGRVGPAPVTSHSFDIQSTVLAGDVLYVHLPYFGGHDILGGFVSQPVIDELRALLQQAKEHRGLVLDLRSNSGGSPTVYLALAGWLYTEPTTLFFCHYKNGLRYTDHGPKWPMSVAPDPSLSCNSPLALLVNSRTFGAGDFTTYFLQATDRATTFGEPSGGGFGNGNTKPFDAGWTLGFNDILCTDLEGNPLEGNPPDVDVPVQYTSADLAQGVDTVIEAARSWVAAQ